MSLNVDVLPTYGDVEAAAKRLDGVAVKTPLLRSDVLDQRLGARLFVKAECLQRTGSFKFRGAYNRLSQLSEEEKSRGVLAYSSGNHAQGIAAAAKLVGTSAKILMPKDAPAAKVDGVRFWGGEVIHFDRATEVREEIGQRIAREEGRVIVPPYDDPHIIAGQGTAGREAMLDFADMNVNPDIVVCCAGGGGLIAGVGLAAKTLSPATEIWAAEPAGFDDLKRTIETGKRIPNTRLTGSICDAIITPIHGEMTWALNRTQLSGGAAITDDEALDAMAQAWRHLKLVVEPGGAAALAAVLSGKIDIAGKTVCVLATGGNVDRAVFQKALEQTRS
ncbi:MAG: threonine/serine dehydratase [Alphaproteobacteria bacterium]|nr:threonine/serine dehydratase [Alphaproteobacteria bacterium]